MIFSDNTASRMKFRPWRVVFGVFNGPFLKKKGSSPRALKCDSSSLSLSALLGFISWIPRLPPATQSLSRLSLWIFHPLHAWSFSAFSSILTFTSSIFFWPSSSFLSEQSWLSVLFFSFSLFEMFVFLQKRSTLSWLLNVGLGSDGLVLQWGELAFVIELILFVHYLKYWFLSVSLFFFLTEAVSCCLVSEKANRRKGKWIFDKFFLFFVVLVLRIMGSPRFRNFDFFSVRAFRPWPNWGLESLCCVIVVLLVMFCGCFIYVSHHLNRV